jgi:hypothetical protein
LFPQVADIAHFHKSLECWLTKAVEATMTLPIGVKEERVVEEVVEVVEDEVCVYETCEVGIF